MDSLSVAGATTVVGNNLQDEFEDSIGFGKRDFTKSTYSKAGTNGTAIPPQKLGDNLDRLEQKQQVRFSQQAPESGIDIRSFRAVFHPHRRWRSH